MQHAQQHPHHHIDRDTMTALLAGPIALVAFVILFVWLHDAPVAHAAHTAVTGR